jgi:transposase-like protein
MHDEAAAFAHVEAMQWPHGPVCPSCGCVNNAAKLTGIRSKASQKNPDSVVRHGLWRCRDCCTQFTVRKNTVFEESHIALHLWLQAVHLMASSKKGISSHQLARTLEITQKSAWFLAHRIRMAMSNDGDMNFGANGGEVEVDETFFGREPGKPVRRGVGHKVKMLTLLDRDTKTVKSVVVDNLKVATLLPILRENIAKEATIYTDEAMQYDNVYKHFAAHQSVNHAAEEYVRGVVTTNTVESYFSVFKRGMGGTYQHSGKAHLHCYAAELAFRYNTRKANGVNDMARAAQTLRGTDPSPCRWTPLDLSRDWYPSVIENAANQSDALWICK